MPFNTSYVVGGTIDEVKNVNLPATLFPSGNTPKVKGYTMVVPAISGNVQTLEIKFDYDIDLIDLAIACSGYHNGDYWECLVGEEKIIETMFTKELPENISQGNAMRIAYKVKAGTQMVLSFHNISGTSKNVWFTLRYLYKKDGA